MDSDESMIGDSSPILPPNNTQVSEGSTTQYAWVILFSIDLDQPKPFNLFRLSHFKESNFPFDIITGELDDKERTAIREFTNLQGSFHVFAKVERGVLQIYIILCKSNVKLILST